MGDQIINLTDARAQRLWAAAQLAKNSFEILYRLAEAHKSNAEVHKMLVTANKILDEKP